MLRSSTAVLAVEDVAKATAFYVDVLGFKSNWLWGNPPTFGSIGLGAAELFLCLQPELATRVEGHMHFFDVGPDVDALHEQHRAKDAPIIEPLENKPWGTREYCVRGPSGYHLRFSGPATYERPAGATDALPPHVRIDVTPPDVATYSALLSSVGWNVKDNAPEILANTLFAVLATDTRGDDQTVGVTRVTGDGQYFMIWDVVVRPSHQGQKIGSAMVARALAELRRRRAPPGAFVGLFTAKNGFYQTLGFRPIAGMHLNL